MGEKNIISNDIKSLLKISSQVSVYKSLESTNITAKAKATQGAKEGDLIVALKQTGGRGRLGRNFYSPKSSGIYFSLVLRPNLTAEKVSFITPVAAVAVAKAIEDLVGKSPKIKWVNDIFVNDKKVCGILSEAVFNSKGDAEYVILGIGINLIAPKDGFPDDIKSIAGGILDEGERLNANEIVATVVNNFFELYENLNSESTVNEYKKRMLLIGKNINYSQNGEQKSGRVEGIDNNYRLIIKNEKGELTYLQSGEVTIGSKKIHKR